MQRAEDRVAARAVGGLKEPERLSSRWVSQERRGQ